MSHSWLGSVAGRASARGKSKGDGELNKWLDCPPSTLILRSSLLDPASCHFDASKWMPSRVPSSFTRSCSTKVSRPNGPSVLPCAACTRCVPSGAPRDSLGDTRLPRQEIARGIRDNAVAPTSPERYLPGNAQETLPDYPGGCRYLRRLCPAVEPVPFSRCSGRVVRMTYRVLLPMHMLQASSHNGAQPLG